MQKHKEILIIIVSLIISYSVMLTLSWFDLKHQKEESEIILQDYLIRNKLK